MNTKTRLPRNGAIPAMLIAVGLLVWLVVERPASNGIIVVIGGETAVLAFAAFMLWRYGKRRNS